MSLSLKSILLSLLFGAVLFAETHITGDITGMTFESGGNPYIVEQDILVPAGNKGSSGTSSHPGHRLSSG